LEKQNHECKNVKIESLSGMELVSLQKRKMKVASIPIGYSHGYSRSLKSGTSSHQGTTVYRCWFCKYMMTVDVTNLESVKKDDEVVLIGSQNEISISIASFSDYSNQLNYELLTRISKTIPRKIID
jgi:alanine racemase